MSDNEKSIENGGGDNDVRERLTLHVRKRISGELQVVIKQEEATNSSNFDHQSPHRKKSKKSKKRNKSGNSSNKKIKIKEETSTDPASEATVGTPEISDEPLSRYQSPNFVDETAAQAARESFLNNAILSEILNEKKRALFESEEILQLIRERMTNSS